MLHLITPIFVHTVWTDLVGSVVFVYSRPYSILMYVFAHVTCADRLFVDVVPSFCKLSKQGQQAKALEIIDSIKGNNKIGDVEMVQGALEAAAAPLVDAFRRGSDEMAAVERESLEFQKLMYQENKAARDDAAAIQRSELALKAAAQLSEAACKGPLAVRLVYCTLVKQFPELQAMEQEVLAAASASDK
jgi:hypothetical protein